MNDWSSGFARAMLDAYVTKQILEGFGVRPAVQLSTSVAGATAAVGVRLHDRACQDAGRTAKALLSSGNSGE